MTTESMQVPLSEGLFTWPSDGSPHLIGTHCKSCGDYFFPKTTTCRNPRCVKKEVEEVKLSRKGKVFSYSVLCYPPPPPFIAPKPYDPIVIAEVDLPEGLKIIGMMQGCKPADVRFGMDVEIILDKLYTNREGKDIIAWKFKPV